MNIHDQEYGQESKKGDAPSSDDVLRVYLSFNIQQGTYRPFTPMGISVVCLLASSITTLLGFPPPSPGASPGFITEVAFRIFLDVTGALRHPFGRRFLRQAMTQAEAHAATIFQQLVTDPRLSLLPTPRLPFLHAFVRLFVRTRRRGDSPISPGDATRTSCTGLPGR